MVKKYRNVSELYDLTYESRVEDVSFYTDYIATQKANFQQKQVLEVGAGTGRVLLRAAQENPDITFTGLDVISDELDVLERHAKHLGLENLSTIFADFSAYKPEHEYDLIIAPFRVLQHCLSIEDLSTFLRSAHSALSNDGHFVFDLFNPWLEMLCKTGAIFEGEYIDADQTRVIRKVEVNLRDHFNQTQKVEEYFTVEYPDGTKDQFEWIYNTRYFFKDEVRLAIEAAGFNVEHLYGSFQKQPFGHADYPGELIFDCKKQLRPEL